MLAIIGLVVVGAVVAVYFLATHVSEKERAVQRVIELMEQGCELLEESPDESMDLSTAARFLKLVTELQEIEEEFGTMRSRMSDRALDAKYGAKLKALVKRMERATERRRAAGG